MSRADVAVVGLGPAGRALAHRLARRGARVVACDPAPDAVWTPTYGGWADQLPAWCRDLPGASSERVALIARGRHALPGRYLVLDNAALHARLALDGVSVRAETLSLDAAAALADVVIDCRGARAVDAGANRPLQTAHGRVLERDLLAGYLGDADAVLMDWRPWDGASSWGRRRPSFCYVVGLPDGRVLAEETCLVGAPPLSARELEGRLRARLGRHGVSARALADAPAEHVRIPMTAPAAPAGVLRFGSAGDQLNPITGYSVFASLAAADDWAASLLAGRPPSRRRDPWRPLALRALLASSATGTVELFDAFGRLPVADQRAVLDPQAPASALLAAMGRQWWRQPGAGRVRLIGATARGVVAGAAEGRATAGHPFGRHRTVAKEGPR